MLVCDLRKRKEIAKGNRGIKWKYFFWFVKCSILIKIGNIENKDLIIFSFPFMNKSCWEIDEKEMQKREKIVGLWLEKEIAEKEEL